MIFAFCILHSDCFAQSFSSSELINKAKEYDGKTVTYAGEVIGEVMRRGNYSWLNVSDGKNAIGIWAPVGLLPESPLAGNYKTRGDSVEISGEFRRACPEHGGDLDIHLESLRVVTPGGAVVEQPDIRKRNFALGLLGVLFLIWISKLLKKKLSKS